MSHMISRVWVISNHNALIISNLVSLIPRRWLLSFSFLLLVQTKFCIPIGWFDFGICPQTNLFNLISVHLWLNFMSHSDDSWWIIRWLSSITTVTCSSALYHIWIQILLPYALWCYFDEHFCPKKDSFLQDKPCLASMSLSWAGQNFGLGWGNG